MYNTESAEAGGAEAAAASANLEGHQVVDNSTWYQHCGPTYRGICVIYLSGPSGSSASDVLSSVEVAVSSAVSLIEVDGQCKSSFAAEFGIQSESLPTIVVYAPFKSRYTTFRGALSAVSK